MLLAAEGLIEELQPSAPFRNAGGGTYHFFENVCNGPFRFLERPESNVLC